ncbi:unnamed protein product [Macrosiphum euphorbiae]|uniref:Uncharacterized protein n=1 Tax=Macrosiphum euphorbiae TaxID=13131 RepID=A0AAV0X5A6_9HEMI|nr:unnamed protein product [Macrosiphum euphorbiae]
MESFCKRNDLTMTLVKKEPVDECDDHILEEKSKNEQDIKNEYSECNEFGKNNPIYNEYEDNEQNEINEN